MSGFEFYSKLCFNNGRMTWHVRNNIVLKWGKLKMAHITFGVILVEMRFLGRTRFMFAAFGKMHYMNGPGKYKCRKQHQGHSTFQYLLSGAQLYFYLEAIR